MEATNNHTIALPQSIDGKALELESTYSCEKLPTEPKVLNPDKLCLPDLTSTVCDQISCPTKDKPLGLCINKACDPNNSLPADQRNLCNTQIACFYDAYKIIASCQIALGTLKLLQEQFNSDLLDVYCDKLCVNYPDLTTWCKRDVKNQTVVSLLEECIARHYEQTSFIELSVNKKHGIEADSAPFWLPKCRDFSIGTLQPDFFLCTY